MMGIRHVLLAVNKMDLVGYEPARLRRHRRRVHAVRGSVRGDLRPADSRSRRSRATTSIAPSARMPWYTGPTVMELPRDRRMPGAAESTGAFRMPVQWSIGPTRTSAASPAGSAPASVQPGDRVRVLPSGVETAGDGDRHAGRRSRRAEAGDSITLTLDRRSRRQPRRRHRRRSRAAAGRRSVRGPAALDGRRTS